MTASTDEQRLTVGRIGDEKIDKVLARIDESTAALLANPQMLDATAQDNLSKVVNGYLIQILNEYQRIPLAWRDRTLPHGSTPRAATGRALELFAMLLQRDEERIYGRSANYLVLQQARLEEQARDADIAAVAEPSDFGPRRPGPLQAALTGGAAIVVAAVLLFLLIFFLTYLAVR